MADWSSYVVAVTVVGVLALLLRWAYGGRSRSLVQRRVQPGHDDQYGLLVSVASPGTFIEGELARQRLRAAGIKAQLVTTADGARLMVFETDESAARRILTN